MYLTFCTLLQEERVVVVVNSVVTLDGYHLQFFLRQALDVSLHLGIAFFEVFLLNLQRLTHRFDYLGYGQFDVFYILGVSGVEHVLLGQFAPFDLQVVELCHQRHECLFVQSE